MTTNPQDYPFPVYATEGGGYCRLVKGRYIWIEPPKKFPEMQVGGEVPSEWGTIPVNKRAWELEGP